MAEVVRVSLLVKAYTRGPDGRMVIIHPADHAKALAGFESYRQRLYGSEAARALGLQLLPTLDVSDIYAEGQEVEQLRAEAELALAHIETFVAEAEATVEDLRPRFENIIAAARRAAEVGGGVVIW